MLRARRRVGPGVLNGEAKLYGTEKDEGVQVVPGGENSAAERHAAALGERDSG